MNLVLCSYCGKAYDVGYVTVIARYADCSVWRTPCCDHQADDRQYVSLPSYTPLGRPEAVEERRGKTYVTFRSPNPFYLIKTYEVVGPYHP